MRQLGVLSRADQFDLSVAGLDVALVATPQAVIDRWLAEDEGFQWPQGVHQIGDDLFLGVFPHELQHEVVDHCTNRGDTKIASAIAHHYAFWQTVPADASPVHWGADGRLRQLLQVARLLRSHTGDLVDAAAIRGHAGKVVVTPLHGTEVHPVEPAEAWLRHTDMPDLQRLWATWTGLNYGELLPTRVKRALWYFEYLQFVQEIDVRWPLLGTALEALVKVWDAKDGGSTAVFARSGSALAQAAGLAWTESWLRDVYQMRSRFAHGQPPTGASSATLDPAVLREYATFEEGMRQILRALVEDVTVRSVVANDDSVSASGSTGGDRVAGSVSEYGMGHRGQVADALHARDRRTKSRGSCST